MKIFSVQQAREMEEQAYREGASEETFMEQAGAGIASEVNQYLQNHHLKRNVFLLCAKGNNSGDAYVAGRYLLQMDCKVQAFQSVPIETCSKLCKKTINDF